MSLPVKAIDKNICPAIIELNQKGYFTLSSCEGHSWEQPEAFILFAARYKFPCDYPKYWREDGAVLRLDYKSALEGNESFEQVQKRKLKELIEWAKKLPERKASFVD